MRGLQPQGIVAGRIARLPSEGRGSPLAALYDLTFFMQQEEYVRRQGFGVTANLVVARPVFARVGLFNAALKSCGDAEWGRRAGGRRVALRYDPDLVVGHPLLPGIGAVLRKSRRIVGGQFALASTRSRPLPLLSALTREWRDVWARSARFAASYPAASTGLRVRMYALILLVQLVRIFERLRLYCGGRPRRQ
jgi:hypothetical protein